MLFKNTSSGEERRILTHSKAEAPSAPISGEGSSSGKGLPSSYAVRKLAWSSDIEAYLEEDDAGNSHSKRRKSEYTKNSQMSRQDYRNFSSISESQSISSS